MITLRGRLLGAILVTISFSSPLLSAPNTSNCPLPNGCQLLGSTTLWSGQWLQCHRNQPQLPVVNFVNQRGIGSGCDLSNPLISQIASNCSRRLHYPTVEDQVLCMGRYIRIVLPPGTGPVCRHYSRCVYKVMSRFEDVQRRFLESRYVGNLVHVWNEIAAGSTTVVADVANGIYFSCPAGR